MIIFLASQTQSPTLTRVLSFDFVPFSFAPESQQKHPDPQTIQKVADDPSRIHQPATPVSLWSEALPAVAWLSVSVTAASTLACLTLSFQIISSLLGDFLVSVLPSVSVDEFRIRRLREERKSARRSSWVSTGMTIPVGACASAWHRAVTGEWDALCVSLTACCIIAWVGLLAVMSSWDALQLLYAAYRPCIDTDDILGDVAGPGLDSGFKSILPGDAPSASHPPNTDADVWYGQQIKGTALGRKRGKSRPPRRIDIIGIGLLSITSTTAYAYTMAWVVASSIPAVSGAQ